MDLFNFLDFFFLLIFMLGLFLQILNKCFELLEIQHSCPFGYKLAELIPEGVDVHLEHNLQLPIILNGLKQLLFAYYSHLVFVDQTKSVFHKEIVYFIS